MKTALSLSLLSSLCYVSLPARAGTPIGGVTTSTLGSGKLVTISSIPANIFPLPSSAGGIFTAARPVNGNGNILFHSAAAPTTVTIPPAAAGNIFLSNQSAGSLTIAGSAAPITGTPGPYFAQTAGFPAMPAEQTETVTYLGVETSRVTAALAAQLSLPAGTGLVVTSIDADSPAASVLKPYDILLKLDDQQLIVQLQLSVLIRNRRSGDEVSVSYLRTGRPATAKIKLSQHDVPKLPALPEELALNGGMIGFSTGPGASGVSFGGGPVTTVAGIPAIAGRHEADRILAGLPHGPGDDPMAQMQIDNRGAPGLSAVAVDPANSRLVYNDETGSLELTIKDGQKTLTAKDPKGSLLFDGPANTPDERKAMPAAVRASLERLESMQNSSFRTNGQFLGNEPRIALPGPRSI